MKRLIFGVLLIALTTVSAWASRKDEVTLIMIPREADVQRVGLDLSTKYPTLLISYKVARNGGVSLHGWTGKAWVNIKFEDFLEGGFFRTGPNSALIVEKEGVPVPDKLIPSDAWCDEVYKITTTDIRPLLHLSGQYYDFKFKEWSWFSENYKLSMDAINPEGLNVSWYHKRFKDNLKKKGAVGANDLQYWVAERFPQLPIEPVEPVEPVEPAESVESVETNGTEVIVVPESELKEEPISEDPFTSEVQEAVILGAGEAEEAVVVPPVGE